MSKNTSKYHIIYNNSEISIINLTNHKKFIYKLNVNDFAKDIKLKNNIDIYHYLSNIFDKHDPIFKYNIIPANNNITLIITKNSLFWIEYEISLVLNEDSLVLNEDTTLIDENMSLKQKIKDIENLQKDFIAEVIKELNDRILKLENKSIGAGYRNIVIRKKK
jgi:hypothetical protein